MRKLTKEEFVKRAISVHGNEYDYTESVYNGMKENTNIRHKLCGKIFSQTPDNHLSGKGCTNCYGNLLKTTEEFINEFKKIDTCNIDCSKVEYKGKDIKVTLICPIHGEFKKRPGELLDKRKTCACPECSKDRISIGKMDTFEGFVDKARQIHGNKYQYLNYKGSKVPSKIICQIHGEFEQLPSRHLQGHGCQKCKSSHLENEIRVLLENNGVKFKEQYKQQWLGLQSIDFYLPEYKIGIECQGKQHFLDGCTFGSHDNRNTLNEIVKRDKLKLQKCINNGVKLLYYSNLGINYPYTVFEDKNELLATILKNKEVI